ncbi:MAG: sigma-70 family RNA polymerase sigma factor [Deltaproteobacteria bacterium]|nr:sigma-70 family RNA polymerase sigma factor [Deltaproteobacteria bacterium]
MPESNAPGVAQHVLVDHFFRHEYGRLVATLVRLFRTSQIDIIEDAVQTALAKALSAWARGGVPENPSAWLTSVAKNNVLDSIRRHRTADKGAESELSVRAQDAPEPTDPVLWGEIADDQLRMLFVCCEEGLNEQGRLVLALKLLCGFATHEIAARLFISEDNVHKLLSRGRSHLKQAWSAREEWANTPKPERLSSRLQSVQSVIYLLFNEGYSSLVHDAPIRRELCDEAIRLGQLLLQHPATSTPESWALMALMEMHVARFASRHDGQGGLLMLEEQDRLAWDKAGIHRGLECLLHAAQGENFSRYHAEAAVLAEHCIAPTFQQTRWDEIVSLYEMLEARQPSPIHTLNRAIALAEWKGPQAGLDLLRQAKPPSWLSGYYLWDATHGELLRRQGAFEEAQRYWLRAIESAPTKAERAVFEKKLARCADGDASRG